VATAAQAPVLQDFVLHGGQLGGEQQEVVHRVPRRQLAQTGGTGGEQLAAHRELDIRHLLASPDSDFFGAEQL
jgi:hypothetical protein